MLKNIADIIPKELLLAGVAYGALSYFVAGPELFARVARADYIPVCMAEHRDRALSSAKEQAKELSHPRADPEALVAEHQLRVFKNNPAMQELERSGLATLLGLDMAIDLAFAQIEAKRQAALAVIERQRAEIERATRLRLDQSGNLCICAAEQAFDDARAAWAVFAGTFGLVRPEPVRSVKEVIEAKLANDDCIAGKGGAS